MALLCMCWNGVIRGRAWGSQGPPDTVGWSRAGGWWSEVERHACPPRAEWADTLYVGYQWIFSQTEERRMIATCHISLGCESWTTRKAEHQRIDASELWCWGRLLRVLWTARRSNHSILKEISPGCSLAGLMLKLKLQYFGHLMRRADSLEKTLMVGKIEGRRRRG